MKTKEELAVEIRNQINKIKDQIDPVMGDDKANAMNRVAISNLYIALSNLTK